MSALERQLEALGAMCKRAMRQRVLDTLRAHGRPMTTAEIAAALEIEHEAIQRTVCRLYLYRMIDAERRPGRKPAWYAETVGACEWCGLVDHHLVAGECASCRAKTTTLEASHV
ncbi:MarR family transcriptional regulator [Arhodomonas aquaeolei]|uniref:MarR family transcriptional regulator n=1 Tax=Arhodomonas aquaeolei TaxID=2369 RepID=UPI002167494D|nr:MarR family transcriptional regulator [Arhodomonas aquaeolei]MCS4503865.1 MarR family transcriptional regulator [Arhodomonas aquaeolei]